MDRIRRQKADLEDVLVHVHDETPEAARFQAGMTGPNERDAILAGYEAMEDKPSFTPWQVSASEALRDGDAAAAIEALRVRGRLHLCHDEEKTLTRLVDDWERHVRAEPDKSTIVLARTRAEARALSYLMRERVLGHRTDIKRAVIEVSRDVDGRVTEPLEIAVGDRLRIGATQWDKQLFNGTVITVEDLEVRRKKRSRTEAEANGAGARPEEPSVLITARTDDGRMVKFRHDEIRDYKDNIRLDYGYALTIASAQGLTVDRAFLLADARPARETIYPAATRHREGLDIYVNRVPLVFDITERRPEDQADKPVMDTDIRAHLAERWSRSQPKEAALDYIADGAWRDPREGVRKDRAGGEVRMETGETRPPANDNALIRIAGEIRHAALCWRHGAAVDAFAAERGEVLTAWDELRERTRAVGDAVALSPAFRETLDRHAALLKQAAPFRARPRTFDRLLAERAGIGRQDLDAFEALHARAGTYWRSAAFKAARAQRIEERLDHERTDEPVGVEASIPDWRALYDALQRDWNELIDRATQPDLPLLLFEGYDDLIVRVRALAEHPDIADKDRNVLTKLIEFHDGEIAARETVRNYLAAAERHVKACDPHRRVAGLLDIHLSEVTGYREWLGEAGRLVETGRAILADEDSYGPWLASIAAGKPRARLTVDQLRNRIEEGHVETPKAEERQSQREPAPKQEEGIAYILNDPEKLREFRERRKEREERERKEGKGQRKGRHWSMRM